MFACVYLSRCSFSIFLLIAVVQICKWMKRKKVQASISKTWFHSMKQNKMKCRKKITIIRRRSGEKKNKFQFHFHFHLLHCLLCSAHYVPWIVDWYLECRFLLPSLCRRTLQLWIKYLGIQFFLSYWSSFKCPLHRIHSFFFFHINISIDIQRVQTKALQFAFLNRSVKFNSGVKFHCVAHENLKNDIKKT